MVLLKFIEQSHSLRVFQQQSLIAALVFPATAAGIANRFKQCNIAAVERRIKNLLNRGELA